jgi:hypothetical protein
MKKSNANAMPEVARKFDLKVAADLVTKVKELGPDQKELKKQLNKERIKALGLTLIQGGKSEE